MEIFLELSLILLITTIISAIMKFLRQPFIVGYILAGIVIGPHFLNLIKSQEEIETFSKIGITILLFIVGLNLNPKIIREVGRISLVSGLGQFIFTTFAGFGICLLLGLDAISSIYVSIALTFSSTIIILKLLSDKNDLDKLYGKISIGFLIVQDLIASIILIAITTYANAGEQNVGIVILMLLLKGIGIGLLLFFANKFVFPKLSNFLASSQELLFLFSLAWGLCIASLSHVLGFSVEIGALVAGVTLSTLTFSPEIGSRMKPLRDFFVLLFFVLLGTQIAIDSLPQILVPAIVLSLYVLFGNPIIMMVLMNLLGYKSKTGFLTGLTVAQISEFSLILVSLGFAVGHLTENILSLVTLVGLITISGSSYLIIYSEEIYPKIKSLINIFAFRKISKETKIEEKKNSEVILFGYDRVGKNFVEAIKKISDDFVVVDFNPASIKRLEENNIPYKYGDAEDVEFLDEVGLGNIRLAISTIPDFATNKLLVKKITAANSDAITIMISQDIHQAQELYDAGATYVIMPHYLGARFATKMISKFGLDRRKFSLEREKHIKHLLSI